MKRITLLLGALIIVTGKVFAKTAQGQEKAEATIKPFKVSELTPNLFSTVYDFFTEIKTAFFEGFVSLKDFVETGEWLIAELKTPEMRELAGSFGIRLAVSLALAFAIAQLITLWLKPKIHRLLLSQEYLTRSLLSAALLSTAAPLVFGFCLYTIFRTINPNDGIYLETVRILSSGSVVIWILLNEAHIFLRPPTPNHQQIPLSPEALNSLYVWVRRMAYVALFGFFALETGRLIHLPLVGERLLLQTSSFVIIIMAIFMVLSLNENLSAWIQKQKEHLQRSRLKRSLLPYLKFISLPLVVFIGISYISWASHEHDRFQLVIWKSLLTLSLLPFLQYLAYCLKKVRILYIHKNVKRFSATFSKRALFYGRQIDFVLISLLYFAAVIFVLVLWGFNPYCFLLSDTCRLIFEKTFSIIIIISVALFVSRAGTGLLNKHLNSEEEAQDEAHKQKMARLKTISSISRNVLRIAVWTPAFLLILTELEVPIFPLLASLGIASFGLSFGFQSLIKDFATGFFMLLEDAFAVGDLVVINDQMGRIESLTVRVVRLRATDGSLYTFPYGNITTLCNQNRDFSAAVILFQVGIDTDISQVNEILEKISKDLRKDPKTRSLVMDSIQIDGINEVSDHALQIRAIVKTKPSMHYKVRWAFNLLLKQYLELYHIPSATPRQFSYNYALEK